MTEYFACLNFLLQKSIFACKWPCFGGQLLRAWVESPILWPKDADGAVSHMQHTNAPTVAPSIAPTDQTDKCSLSRPVAVHSGRLGRGLLYSCHWEPGLECNLHNLRNLRSKCAPILYLLSCLQPRPHTAQWPSNGIDNNIFSSHFIHWTLFNIIIGLLTRTRKKAAWDNC